jgi:hypothetical protein
MVADNIAFLKNANTALSRFSAVLLDCAKPATRLQSNSRNSCRFNGGLSCVIFGGHRSCGKSALAQLIVFVSESVPLWIPPTTKVCALYFYY